MVSHVNPMSASGQYGGGASNVQVAQQMVKTLLQNLNLVGSSQGEADLQKNLLQGLNDLNQSQAMTPLYQIVNNMNGSNEINSISKMLTTLSGLDSKLQLDYYPSGSSNPVSLLPLSGAPQTIQNNIAQVICNYAINSTPNGLDMKGAQNLLNDYINDPTSGNFNAFSSVISQYLNA